MYNKYLDIFICVADEGSFNKASKKLFISANAVMKKINILEEQLGLKLFHRSNHGLTLTIAGKLIYQESKQIIHESNATIRHAQALTLQSNQIVRIGSSLMRPCDQIVQLWQKIGQLHPHIKLKVVSFSDERNNFSKIIEHLGEKIDIIVAVYPSNKFNNQCQVLNLGQVKLACAIPITHRLAKRKLLHLNDLKDEKVVMVKRGKTEYMDQLRDKIQKDYPKIQIIDDEKFDIDTLNYCVQKNLIMIVADSWKNIHPSFITIPIDKPYSLPYGLIYAKHPSEGVRDFIKAIKKD